MGVAATWEWAAPLLLLMTPLQGLVYMGVAMLVAMHLYIISFAPLGVFCWNTFSACAAVYLFLLAPGGTGESRVGLDYEGLCTMSPLLTALLCLEALLVIVGHLRPD